ncbi:MAG: FtsX-like permease family protein [Pseudomonadota bacterium]
MIVLKLAWESLKNRWLTAGLTVLAIAISVFLVLGVEKVREGVRAGFINTISGTDLIVGARTGDVQLLLYSVFRMGDATANITWETVEDIAAHRAVAWTVPIALGDSHRGFRVMGTSVDYFTRYRYRRDVALEFATGKAFDDLFDTVVGSEVAERFNYKVGDEIVVAHGAGRVALGALHDDKPFTISGVLAPTGTPVDRTVHVSMEAIEAIHLGWDDGRAPRGDDIVSEEEARAADLSPKSATALMVGLRSPLATFALQRFVNTYRAEPLTAIIPGVAFGRLWSLLSNVEKALFGISAMVVVTAFLGMVISILGSLNERRREMAILRSLGARPWQVLALFVMEAALLAIVGALIGAAAVYGALFIFRDLIETATGLYMTLTWPDGGDLTLLIAIVAGGILAGLVPAIRAYTLSLSDGLLVRS